MGRRGKPGARRVLVGGGREPVGRVGPNRRGERHRRLRAHPGVGDRGRGPPSDHGQVADDRRLPVEQHHGHGGTPDPHCRGLALRLRGDRPAGAGGGRLERQGDQPGERLGLRASCPGGRSDALSARRCDRTSDRRARRLVHLGRRPARRCGRGARRAGRARSGRRGRSGRRNARVGRGGPRLPLRRTRAARVHRVPGAGDAGVARRLGPDRRQAAGGGPRHPGRRVRKDFAASTTTRRQHPHPDGRGGRGPPGHADRPCHAPDAGRARAA